MKINPFARRQGVDFDIAIIGAGFSGLGMAIRLKQAGIDSFTIYERADEVGGTWRDNHYPGAACDVASHLYSFSFDQNADWSRAYGEQPEIFDYIRDCTERYGLREHIRFNSEITRTEFDDETGLWTGHTSDGHSFTARAVITGTGALSDPALPAIPGIDDFGGQLFHTATWDDDYDLSGKKVAFIGSGASAIQAMPAIAEQVEYMSVFQRTPSWIMPKPDRAIGAAEKRLYRLLPPALHARRLRLYWENELYAPFVISDIKPLKDFAEGLARRHIRRQVKDPALRQAVTPDYRIGCKRVLISNDWYPALQRDNVTLETDGIERITERGIVTRDGREVAVDVIVCATGFKVPSQAAPFPVHGRDGLSLNDAWRDGAKAYKGMTVSGFPNLFFLMGPNTGPGHTSVLAFTEKQMDYTLQAIQYLGRHDLKYIDVKHRVQERFNRELQWRMKHTAWTSGCNSWYLTDSGKNTTLYPGFNWEYRLRVRRFAPGDYVREALSDESLAVA